MKAQSHHRYLTLARDDHRFMPHLLGTFSNRQRALPVDALFENTKEEKVTFQIVPLSDLQLPRSTVVFFRGIRPVLLPLTIGPAASVLAYAIARDWEVHPWVIISSLLALLFWHGATFLLNDYFDHVSGLDLKSALRGSQIIQRGWVTADRVKQWSLACWLIGAAFGLPAIWSRPIALLLIGGSAALVVMKFSKMNRGTKYFGFGNLMIFLGMGPLLTSGLSLAISGQMDFGIVILGIICGLGSSLCIQLRNMETMLADSQAKAETFISRLGIEKSKVLILGQLLLMGGFLGLLVLTVTSVWIYGLVLIPVAGSGWRLIWRLRAIHSPLSSQLFGLWQEGLVLHFLAVIGAVLLFYLAWLSHS